MMEPLHPEEAESCKNDGLTPVRMWNLAMCYSMRTDGKACETPDGSILACSDCRYHYDGD